jgi:hypothetical protein
MTYEAIAFNTLTLCERLLRELQNQRATVDEIHNLLVAMLSDLETANPDGAAYVKKWFAKAEELRQQRAAILGDPRDVELPWSNWIADAKKFLADGSQPELPS